MPILADDQVVRWLPVDGHYFRIMVTGIKVGMNKDIAKPLCQAFVLFGANLLITEEDDAVIQQSLADLCDYGRTLNLAKIDA